jgi:hypothetical protein
MRLKRLFISWLGALLFLVGVAVGLALSASVVWAESEAVVYSSYNGERNLVIKCPLMISPAESGMVHAEIINLTDEEIKPVISAEISHSKAPREINQTVPLASGESGKLQWVVDSSDVIFERLILVNVLQSRYRDSPARAASCGILVYHLFGLTGTQSFAVVFAISLVIMLSGGWLWLSARGPSDKSSGNIVQINAVLLGVTILALLSTWARWWGLTLFFDALIVLVLGVIVTEFILFPQKSRD